MSAAIPEAFARALATEFGGQVRVRWSRAKDRFVIERKTARGREDSLLPPMPGLAKVANPEKRRALELWFEERLEQARSGFYPILEVCPGDRTACPKCRRTTHVRIREMRTSRCQWCRHEFRAVYWPLTDSLIEQLRWSDPDRGGLERAFQAQDQAEQAVAKAKKRQLANETEAVWKDAFTHVFEIPSVGYTGKSFDGRPASPAPVAPAGA